MKGRVTWIVIGAVAIVGAVVGLLALRGDLRPFRAQPPAPATGVVETVDATTTVEGSGAIEPQQSADLFWLTTGIVATVNVEVGDQVNVGDVLMTIEPATAPGSVIQAQSELIAAQTALDELLDPTALSIANAQQAVADAQDALDDAQRSLRNTTTPDIQYYQDAVADAEAALVDAQANLEKANIGDLARALERAEDELQLKTDQLNDVKVAQEKCPNCIVVWANATGRMIELADAEQEYQVALDAYRVAELNYQQALASNDTSVQDAEEALDDARQDLAYAQQGPGAIDLALKQAAVAVAEARLADALETLDRLVNGADPDDIAAAEARVMAAQATVESVVLRAPFDGQVLAVYYQPGDPATQAQAAMRLANRSRLHVNIAVDETEVGQIEVGDPVRLTVDAWPGLEVPAAVGAIETFGETVQGLVRYNVRVDLPENDPRLYLNMTASAIIVTAEQAGALAVPLDAVQFDAQGEFVNRMRPDGTAERVDIVSGQIVGDLVLVTGNLQPGETVQVVTPTPEPPGGPFGGG
jgi:HlyD family secretion protein